MHIVLIPAWYELPENGHLGIFVRDIAEGLALRGHTVAVLAFKARPGLPAEVIVRKDPIGFNEYYMYEDAPQGLRGYQQLSRAASVHFDKYIKEHGQVDVLNTHGLIALNYIKKIHKNHTIRVVHTEHLSLLVPDHIHFLLRWRVRKLYRHADQVVAVGRRLADNLKTLSDTPVAFIPGMVHQAFFQTPLQINNNPIPAMVCVSDFDERKGQPMLLEALAIIHQNSISFKLHLVGDGPLREKMEEFVRQNDMEQEVIFHGKQNRPYIIDLMARASIYCTAVKLENFATHIAEALAMGLFVVTTDSIGPNFYLHADNSIIIKDYNPATLAAAIQQAIEHQLQIDKHAIRRYIASLSAPEEVLPQLESVFK